MDATLWHTHAGYAPTRPDTPTLAELRRLTDVATARHQHEVRAWVSRIYVATDQTRALEIELTRVVDDNRVSLPGAKSLSAVTGPNTVGKSTFVKHWAMDTYRDQVGDDALARPTVPRWDPEPGVNADLIPVVWLNLKGMTATGAFDTNVVNFLGYPITRAKEGQAVRALAQHGVRLLIVDDAHFLRTTNAIGRGMLDHLKQFNTELGEYHGSMVLVGANLHGTDLFADPQIAGRLQVTTLTSFTLDSAGDKLAWQRLLKQFETELLPYLPAASPGCIYGQAGLVWRRTQGYMQDVVRLLVGAATTAVRDQTWTITPGQLEAIELSARARTAEASVIRAAGRKREAG